MRKKIIIVGVVALAALSAWALWFYLGGNGKQAGNSAPGKYSLAKIELRDLMKTTSATGTLSAVTTVEVGSQISGQISELLADYNSTVKKDQIIARINSDNYEAKLRQAQAELAVAKAKLLTQQADVERSRAEVQNAQSSLAAAQAQADKAEAVLANAERTMKRKKALIDKEYVSKTDYDTAFTSYQEAKAQLRQAVAQVAAARSQVTAQKASLTMGQAKIKEAEANVQLKEASLQNCRVDLEHTIIRSPVDGVVIDRNVDVGQTVAASLQAPVLFTIAQDLREMEVSTSVDEADIGNIREGQPAYFTVDAFGTRRFNGRVNQIRKAAKTVQNVVTYTVVVSSPNPDMSLMPGMTADVHIVVARKRQVPAAPNAALRFQPAGQAKSQESGTAKAAGSQANGGPGARLKRLVKELNLSQEQQDKLKESLQKIRDKIAASRQPGGLMPPRTGRISDQIRKQFQAAIMVLLTPEQKEKFLALSSGRASNQTQYGNLWTLGPDGQPQAIRVALGVSDGSFTEVRAKGLKPGLQVIVGNR